MHHEFNAFLLIFLILAAALYATPLQGVKAAGPSVTFGIRIWNYNATHVVPSAQVSIFNGTRTVSGTANQTGWANFTATNFGLGNYTLQVKFPSQNIIIYNGTLNVDQPTIYRALNTTVADHTFIFVDNLSRLVEQVSADLQINSTVISSSISAANGTALLRSLPFHTYNLTLTREGVNLSKSTFTLNATTVSLNTVTTLPTYNYIFTARDYRGASILLSGTVSVYDWEVSTNNATKTLANQATFTNLWPGVYLVVVASSNVIIWRSSIALNETTTQDINADIGYTITLHVLDVLGRPISSVSVNLIQNGVAIATAATESNGIATFTNLPASTFQLRFTLLQRSYTTFANITGASIDTSIKLDDIMLIGNAPFNTAPIAASSALVLTVIAIFGTVLVYLRRKNLSNPVKSKQSPK